MPEPLGWIRSFEAAARRGSLTLAATELGLTQAAVSQHIKALEGRLAVQLFLRQPRGVSLTGAGTELYADVSAGLGRIDEALARFVSNETTKLRIICNTSFAIRWLLPRLPEFCRAHRDIDVHFRTALWRTDAIGLKADVVLFEGEAQRSGDIVPIFTGEMITVASPDYSIDVDQRFAIVTGWEGHLAPFASKQPTLEVDSFHAALCFAEAGVAATVCPDLLAKDSLSAGKLVRLETSQPPQKTSYQCSFLESPNYSAKLFLGWIIEQMNTG